MAFKYGDTEEIDESDILLLTYYNYLKINKGITFKEFASEDAYIINGLIHLKSIELEEEDKQVKKAKRKNGK